MSKNTINTCSIFTKETEKVLLEYNITNWLGGQWWLSFDGLFKVIEREARKYIDVKKIDSLYRDIYRLHFWHLN